MATDPNGSGMAGILDNIKGSGDALSVSRVFGAAYEVDGATVIPVARVAGGAGGGGGEGTEADQAGTGFGSGFGVNARPVGVYEVRDGQVNWRPAVDVNRVIRGGQLLAGLIALCVTLVRLRRGG
jgi:uncharacterized spore protein YtfJ